MVFDRPADRSCSYCHDSLCQTRRQDLDQNFPQTNLLPGNRLKPGWVKGKAALKVGSQLSARDEFSMKWKAFPEEVAREALFWPATNFPSEPSLSCGRMRNESSYLRELTAEELQAKLKELEEEVFNLKFQVASQQLENTARLKDSRRDVARLKTVMREKAL